MESGDAETTGDKSNLGIEIGAFVWMVGTCIWMIALQVLLLVIHRSKASRPRNGFPNGAEISIGIALFWTFQLGVGQMLAGMWSIISYGLSEFATNSQLGGGNYQASRLGVDMGFRWIWSGIVLLFSRVLMTWYLHLGLVFLLNTVVPFWQEFRRNPTKALRKIELRFQEILGFLDSILQDPFSNFSLLPRGHPEEIVRTSSQAIHLERRQTDHPKEGQRRLSWNIVVNKDALDEMKETLGPPGGFGELGFNVARDGVRFEAMGIGTSFNLMFKLREIKGSGTGKESRIRKKHK